MQEWIIAMLVIGVLLILRDMAKTIFSEMKKSAAALACEQYPQKEKMQRYAESRNWRTVFTRHPIGRNIFPAQNWKQWQMRYRKTCAENAICTRSAGNSIPSSPIRESVVFCA